MTRSLKKDKALFRGDDPAGVTIPVPAADASLVRHILYMGGKGRDTPYLSTSEDRALAAVFGTIWETSYNKVEAEAERGVRVRSREELSSLLRGRGHGDARWSSPAEVMLARKYVERWLEHLLDFREAKTEPELRQLVADLFAR